MPDPKIGSYTAAIHFIGPSAASANTTIVHDVLPVSTGVSPGEFTTGLGPAIAIRVNAAWKQLWASLGHAQWRYGGVTITPWQAAPNPAGVEAGPKIDIIESVAGPIAAQILPPSSAVLVKKVVTNLSGLVTPSGRLFLPVVPEVDTTDDGRLTPANVTARNTALAILVAAMRQQPGVPVPPTPVPLAGQPAAMQLRYFDRRALVPPNGRPAYQYREVTGLLAQAEITFLRSRRK
jgi:hypothetical protein